MNKRIFIALTILFAGACAFLFNTFYKEAKNTAITKLNEEQTIHAKQAALGIEDFFATWTRDLNSLSKMDEIIDTDTVGKRYMQLFYEGNQEQISSITRMDERGVILHNFPINSSVRADISDQKHIRELLRDHKPVISDVFKAVEGFDTVALHVPIFRGSAFKGSIGILINFESLAKRYLDVIKIGETGYARVVSRDGTQLYSPTSGFTGKSVFETIKDSPSLMVMVNHMLKGDEGAAIYDFDGTGGRNVGQIREYAVYMPVHIGSTFWSIAVSSAEQDVLSGLISFRNKLALIVGALFICGMVFSTLGAKAWFIVKEEEKRKQAEKKLQESEQIAEKFSALFHAAPFAMALATTSDGVLYDLNQAWLDLAGFTRREDVIGKSSVELGVIREAEPRERILKEFREHGYVRNAEIATCTRAGARLALLVNLDSVDIGGRKFILSAMQNITERKEAEAALRDSEEFKRRIIESSPDCIKVLDLEGNLLSMNSSGQRLLQIDDLTQYLNTSWIDFWQESDRTKVAEAVATARAGDKGQFQAYCPSAMGKPMWWEVVITPIPNANGTPDRLLAISRDITERKHVEEELRQSHTELERKVQERTAELRVSNKALMEYAAKLERLNQELEEFAFVASHDLQEPLRKIRTFASMLTQSCREHLPEQGQEYLARVMGSAKRMSDSIHSLLDYSKMTSEPLRFGHVDLGAIAGNIAADLEPSISLAGGTIEIQNLPTIEADAGQIRQVLQHLIDHSIKFRREAESPMVKIYGETSGGMCSIIVEDNGIGFEEQYLDLIFRPFQQLHGWGEFEGIGMGLALCRKIVERHDGSITARSMPGRGSTFIMRLPVVQREAE